MKKYRDRRREKDDELRFDRRSLFEYARAASTCFARKKRRRQREHRRKVNQSLAALTHSIREDVAASVAEAVRVLKPPGLLPKFSVLPLGEAIREKRARAIFRSDRPRGNAALKDAAKQG